MRYRGNVGAGLATGSAPSPNDVAARKIRGKVDLMVPAGARDCPRFAPLPWSGTYGDSTDRGGGERDQGHHPAAGTAAGEDPPARRREGRRVLGVQLPARPDRGGGGRVGRADG